jgi:hypothetical protein
MGLRAGEGSLEDEEVEDEEVRRDDFACLLFDLVFMLNEG